MLQIPTDETCIWIVPTYYCLNAQKMIEGCFVALVSWYNNRFD